MRVRQIAQTLLISLLKQSTFINLMFRTIFNYFILCILGFGQHAFLHTTCLPRASGDQKMGSDNLEMGLQMVRYHHLGAGNQKTRQDKTKKRSLQEL